MKIKILKANNGDSILVSLNDAEGKCRNILIDGGTGPTYENRKKKIVGDLKNVIAEIANKEEFIDLLILTHIDDDHIGGILNWFQKDPSAQKIVKKVWFNSGKLIAEYLHEEKNDSLILPIVPPGDGDTSIQQGIDFEDYITEMGIWDRRIISANNSIDLLGATFHILSPNNAKLTKLLKEWKKEDRDLDTASKENDYGISLRDHILNDQFTEDNAYPNGSSIAFILSYKGKNFVFLGDSHASVVVDSLKQLGYSAKNPLKAELVKVSHHGSKSNNNTELLKMIDATKFIISTNGDKDNHPHKQFLARLISVKKNVEIWFNYPERIESIFSKQDFIDFPEFKALGINEDF